MHSGKEFLASAENGVQVYFDPINSHAATHLNDTPQLKSLVIEIVENTELIGGLTEFDTEVGRIVGTSDLVKNDDGDEIIYAKRQNREVYTPFNKSKAPQPCSIVAVSLKRQADGTYELQSTWIGSIDSPTFPGDEHETPESKPYWLSHSLVWGTQEIQPGIETTQCPW